MKPFLALGLVAAMTLSAAGQDPAPVFSGPQPGEALGPAKARGVFGPWADKEFDIVEQAGDGPILLVFVHEFNRPTVGMARALMHYAATRREPKLHAAVILLAADATATVAQLQRARHALPIEQPLGVSLDGLEGPGAYGLNRTVSLTVLVGSGKKVTANFALVQPSLNVDAPKIAAAIHAVAGGSDPPPTLKDLGLSDQPAPPAEELANRLRAVIRKTNTDEQTAAAVAALDEYLRDNAAAQKQLGEILQRIIGANKLEDYGTPAAQKALSAWSEKYPGK